MHGTKLIIGVKLIKIELKARIFPVEAWMDNVTLRNIATCPATLTQQSEVLGLISQIR